MKEVLDKFGLGEVLAYLCPGALLICSLLLWGPTPKPAPPAVTNPPPGVAQSATAASASQATPPAPKDKDKESNSEGWETLALSALLFIVAYALGLIVSTVSNEGSALYLYLKHGLFSASWNPWRFGWGWAFPRGVLWLLRFVLWLPVAALCGLPDRFKPLFGPLFGTDPSINDASSRIYTDLCFRTNVLRLPLTPWGTLALSRTVLADEAGKHGKAVLVEGDALHRRFLFAQGIALVCALLAVQAAVRGLIWWNWGVASWDGALLEGLPFGLQTNRTLLWWTLIVGAGTSFALRWVLGRWWASELLLTASLLNTVENQRAESTGEDDGEEADSEEGNGKEEGDDEADSGGPDGDGPLRICLELRLPNRPAPRRP